MTVKIENPALGALSATLKGLQEAIGTLRDLDNIQQRPANKLTRLKIAKDGGWNQSSDPDEHEKIFIQAMQAAARRRAAEMGAILRANALDAATDEIERLRAVLCQQAAAATIELAAITRDARERG